MKPIFTEADFAIKNPNVRQSWKFAIRDFWVICIAYSPYDRRHRVGYSMDVYAFGKLANLLPPFPKRFIKNLGDLLIPLNAFLEAIKATKEEVILINKSNEK